MLMFDNEAETDGKVIFGHKRKYWTYYNIDLMEVHEKSNSSRGKYQWLNQISWQSIQWFTNKDQATG